MQHTMDTMLRRFGLKKGEPRESDARLKLQRELFSYNKCVEHGFPNRPSALAYDPKCKLLAIGTKNGGLRVYGAAGIEFSNQHEDDISVTQILFLPGQGRIITQCSDNSLHLWEINTQETGGSTLDHLRTLSMESTKPRNMTSCCLTQDGEQLLVGTEGGNVHILNVYSFQLSEQIIFQDTVVHNVPDDFKVNPGAVEAVAQHPTDPTKFLIGYNRGLIVLWDIKESRPEQTYNAAQQLESVSWHRDGTQFMSAHADGSYIIWSSTDSTKPKEQANAPYGPFPCKAITKLQWKTAKSDPFIVFSGGMPRASYGDRHTVSVMQGQTHVVFDFTSRVVDFVTLCSNEELAEYERTDYDEPHTLLVLAEEEIVAIDIQNEGWQTFRPPYLSSLHSSAITCAQHIANVPEGLWGKISDAGEAQFTNVSPRDWPIVGGTISQPAGPSRDLLITGHEDGSLRFWDASTSAMHLLYHLNTSTIFGVDGPGDLTNNDGDEEWPPFRKVGAFDPYSDDPRLAVQKVSMCALSDTLVVGGTAGQVLIMQFEREEREQEVKVTSVNVVSDRDNFVWKGHEALPVKQGEVKVAAGFQPVAVMQLQPPAAVTALALHSEWQLAAAGTAHGFGVYDYVQKREVATKCTLNPADLTGSGESQMSRRKSFKKSLRESFRRLRKRRSERRKRTKDEAPTKVEEVASPTKTEEGETAAASSAGGSPRAEPHPDIADAPRPVERQIEARSVEDSMGSMVRCLYFCDTFLMNTQSHGPTLWAGTNLGTVYIYQVTMPATDKRDTENVQCVLGKEVQLKHRAPVISVCVIDKTTQPLPAPLECANERAKPPNMTGGHSVVIVSEEQFKIFSLPALKAQNKFKLTAHEGCKVRKVAFINFRSRSDEKYTENDLACLTNNGEVQVYNVPQLRRQLRHECVQKENVSGITSSVFTQNGEGFYLASPSEFVRFSLSARFIIRPLCALTLGEDVRPVIEPEPLPEVTAAGDAPHQEDGGDNRTGNEADNPADDSADQPTTATEGADEVAADMSNMTIDSANLTVDSANLTNDSVRVHLSEEVTSSSRITTTVVTRTVVSETTPEGTTTQESTTVEQSVTASDDQAATDTADATDTTPAIESAE